MDYKNLIKDSRELGDTLAEHFKGAVGEELQKLCFDSADAIETLLAERDAAIEESRGDCKKCRFTNFGEFDYPCFRCSQTGGKVDYWEWRGPQKGSGV